MDLRRVWYILTIVGVLATTFYLGTLYGGRDRIDKQDDYLTVIGPNSSIQNSLSQIETRPVLGSADAANISTFGQFYFKIVSQDKVEILVRLENVPASVVQSVSKGEKSIPNELNIALARSSVDGLDYNYETIGKLIFNEPNNNFRTASFSTTINADLSEVKRIVLLPTRAEDENIYREENNPDLPPRVRQRPSPYFWIVI